MTSERRRRKVTRRMSLKRKRRMTVLFFAAVFLILLVFAGSYLALRKYVNTVEGDIIADNISIGTVDVSGLTRNQAKELLEEHLAEDRAVTVSLKTENGSADATLEELGLSSDDLDSLTKEAVDYGKKGSVWTRYRRMKRLEADGLVIREKFTLDKELTEAVLNERAVPLIKGAQDAAIEKTVTGFKITPEQEGKAVDIEATIEVITEQLNQEWNHEDFSVEVSTKKEEPEITEEDLSEIQDELGSFWTDAGGGERWNNLKTGTERLNGKILMPGETLSVGQVTGPYTAENGYVEAGAYENGQVVSDYGGGICQVSTTLYNAVIYAELEIVERAPHSMTVAYVKPSRDAAIAGDYLDFKFKNSYDTPIYIYGEINSSNQLQFIIYGKDTRPEGRKVEYESETVSTTEHGTTYKENPEAAFGTMTSTGSPHDGVEARLWKIVYEDGEEVSREVFNTSSYSASDEIIEVGTAGGSEEAVAALQSAIASQDAAKISEAVSKGGGQATENQEDAAAQQTDQQAREQS